MNKSYNKAQREFLLNAVLAGYNASMTLIQTGKTFNRKTLFDNAESLLEECEKRSYIVEEGMTNNPPIDLNFLEKQLKKMGIHKKKKEKTKSLEEWFKREFNLDVVISNGYPFEKSN